MDQCMYVSFGNCQQCQGLMGGGGGGGGGGG